MCEAEDELQDVQDELSEVTKELNELKQKYPADDPMSFFHERLHRMSHDPKCFTQYAGCVCIKDLEYA